VGAGVLELSEFTEMRNSAKSMPSFFFLRKMRAAELLWIGLSPIQRRFSAKLCGLCERV
jgi:hypothetical protein